tara:strand:+ start:655 stop:1239 length:585 start_codon:yes stop_codon:yes gene_type:complete
MKLMIYTAPDGALWVIRPMYLDLLRPRHEQYVNIKLPDMPTGETSVTVGNVTRTLNDLTVDGVSIYTETEEEFLERAHEKCIDANNDNSPVLHDTVCHTVEHTAVPGDHVCAGNIRCEFRNAWEWTGQVSVNRAKAEVIKLDLIRRAINREIRDKYILGDAASEALRTAYAAIDLSQYATIPDLHEAWLEDLPR